MDGVWCGARISLISFHITAQLTGLVLESRPYREFTSDNRHIVELVVVGGAA